MTMGEPITITYVQAVKAGACIGSLAEMGSYLYGWHEYGRDKPVPLALVLDVLGFDDCLWALDVVSPHVCRLVATDFAAHVAHLNTDHRVWNAINVARLNAHGLATDAARDAARDAALAAARAGGAARDAALAAARAGGAARDAALGAAWGAALAAAWGAARYSALAAAGYAAQAQQKQHLRNVVSGHTTAGKAARHG
jgi:hypothetical protein